MKVSHLKTRFTQSEKISWVNRRNTLLMQDNGFPIRWERILHNLLKRLNPSGFTSLAVANIQQFQLYDKNNVKASVYMNGYCWLCAVKRTQNI